MRLKLNKDLRMVLILGGISSIIWIVFRGPIIHPDSWSYIAAIDSVFNGVPDWFRTPVYPTFLALLKWVFGENLYLWATIVIQHLVFLCSVVCLFRLCQKAINSDTISFWITLFYAVYPYISSLNSYIVTESFSISGTVFLLFLALRLKENGMWKDALLLMTQLAFLLLLKPALVYLVPLLIVLWVYTFFMEGKRKSALLGIAGVIVAGFCLVSYMQVFKKQYGVFSASVVSTLNNYHIARTYGLLKPELIENPAVRADLEKSIEINGECPKDIYLLYNEAVQMVQDHSMQTIGHEVSICMRYSPINSLKALIFRLYSSADDPLLVKGIDASQWGHLLCFHISTLYLFLLIYTILLVLWFIRRRSIPWFTALIYMVGVSQIIVSVIAAQWDWGRLLLPALPAYLLMIGQVCQIITIKSLHSLEFV